MNIYKETQESNLLRCLQYYQYCLLHKYTIHEQYIILENFENLPDEFWEMLKYSQKTTIKLKTCNGLTAEIIEKLYNTKNITYQFAEENQDLKYTNDELNVIYQVLDTIKYITDNVENNVQKILLVCKIITYLVWQEPKGSIKHKDSNQDIINETRSLKGSIFKGIAVCQGYAILLRMVLSYIGIETKIIGGIGESGEPHAWNQVKDDIFYNLDLTYDWQAFLTNSTLKNTLKNDADFYINHSINTVWEDYSELQKCPISIPVQDLNYYYPELPIELKEILINNQSKGLDKILKYREQYLSVHNNEIKGRNK